MIRRQEERNETFCARSLSWTVPSSGIPSGDRTLGVLRVLNSNRLRTFEDARLEIVTYVGCFEIPTLARGRRGIGL